MAELSTDLLAGIASGAACVAGLAAGVAVRRRSRRIAAGVDWTIHAGGKTLRVRGPFRDSAGRIHAVTAEQQTAWSKTFGGRLPTAAEFDQIWSTADVRVPVHTWPNGIGPLTSLDTDARKAGAKIGDRIAAGKTWLAAKKTTNYGFFVPAAEVKADAAGALRWKGGSKAYPTTIPGWYVLQAPGEAHGPTHRDYSQAGYAVIELGDLGIDLPSLELPGGSEG